MPSSSRHDSLRDFLVEHARIDEATAELYAKRLVDDGFDDIESLHDDLLPKDLAFFKTGHARRLLKALDARNSGAARTRPATYEGEDEDGSECGSPIEDGVEASAVLEETWRRSVSPIGDVDEEQAQRKASPVSGARVRAMASNSNLGRVLPDRGEGDATSPRGLTRRGHRRLRVHELIWQRRKSDDAPAGAQQRFFPGNARRPESAPTEKPSEPQRDGTELRSQSHQARRRAPPAGIVMATPPKHSVATTEAERRAEAKHTVEYSVSAEGVLRMGDFVIGPEGAEAFASPSLRNELIALDELGRGAGGCVQRALHVPSGIIVAVKRMGIDDEQRLRQMVLELRALHGLKGPTALAARIQHGLMDAAADAARTPSSTCGTGCRYVVDFLDTFVDPAQNSLCLVLEFMNGGSLHDLKRRRHEEGEGVDERILARVAYCALSALAFIHGRRELHRDIKPSNILLNMRGEVKVSDYGCHRALDEGNSLAETFTGTLAFMSPERIAGEGYSYSSDIWSLGLSLLATATGENPYSKHQVYWDMAHAIQDAPPPKLDANLFSADFRHFVYRCLQKEPSARPSAADLLQHSFVRGGRRTCLGPLIARLGAPLDEGHNEQKFGTMLQNLHEAHVRRRLQAPSAGGAKCEGDYPETPRLSPKLLGKIAAQLGVSLEALEATYANVSNRPLSQSRPTLPGEGGRGVDDTGRDHDRPGAAADDALNMSIKHSSFEPRFLSGAQPKASTVSPTFAPQLMASYESHASSNGLDSSTDTDARHSCNLNATMDTLGTLDESASTEHFQPAPRR